MKICLFVVDKTNKNLTIFIFHKFFKAFLFKCQVISGICFIYLNTIGSERVMYNIKLVGAIIAVFNEENEVDAHKMKFSVENVIVGPNMDDYYLYESKKGEEYMRNLFPEFIKA